MLSLSELLKKNFDISIDTKQRFLAQPEQLDLFADAIKHIAECYRAGGRLYIAGNGGSAADAQHLAAEFVSKLRRDRPPLAAEALTVDTSILTSIGNDYGFDKIFSRQIAAKMTKKDIFLGITTSGQSANIIAALDTCRQLLIPTVVFTGRDGGTAKHKADYCIVVPSEDTCTIQEVHIALAHTLCEYVESQIFKNDLDSRETIDAN